MRRIAQGNQKVVEDIQKRLDQLLTKLTDGVLGQKTLKVLGHLASAVKIRDYEKASKLQVDLITQYYDEVGFSMIGVKRMLDAAKAE